MKRRLLALGPLLALLADGAASGAPTPVPGSAGRYSFRTYAEDEGLQNLTVECLLQDQTGFLWVGTQDGLFRFDGRRFLRFGREEGLLSTKINCMHETKDGRLYVGTRGGLCRREGARFIALGEVEGIPQIAIPDEGVVSDASGNVYVGTPRGLFVGVADHYRLEPRTDRSKEDSVTGLHVAPGGALVFARGGLLYRREGGRDAELGRARGLPESEPIDETITDGEGRLWVRTLKTLHVLPPEGNRFERVDEGLPAGVNSGRLALDEARVLMVPTERGLARRVGDRWDLLGRLRGLEGDTVLAALVDREGSLWLGLAGMGLAQQLGRGRFTGWGVSDGLPHDVVWSIAREKRRGGQGALWVGTQDGLARIDPVDGSVRIYREKDGLAGSTVYALLAAEDGSIWAGSWPGGVTRLGPEPGRIRRYAARGLAAPEFRVIALHSTASGDLWVGARDGLYRLAGGSNSVELQKVDPLPGGEDPDSVYAFAEDSGRTLFAVGRYGLQCLTGPSPRRYRKKDGLRGDFLSSIVALEDGTLVVGYREALGAERVSFKGERLVPRAMNKSTGLASDKVVFLGREAAGALWLGSSSGLDVFRGGGAKATHYGKSSGLLTEDMDQNAFFAEPDGSVWVGTSRGLARFLPGPEAAPRPQPPIVLTECEAGGRRLTFDQPARLSRRERGVRVSWAGLTFVDPKRVRYRYRLAGLEETPTETTLTEARFAALPTGQYRFEVTALSPEGSSSERPAIFTFEVLPAWWEKWWASAVAVLLFAMLVFSAVRLRTGVLERERRRLEKAIAERSAELAAANRELQEASFTDPLTRLRNRRYFSMVIVEDVKRALRAYSVVPAGVPPRQRDLIFYVVDLDHFKAINDLYGHDAGDRVLIEAAVRLRSVTRQSDLTVRWGGEEFLVVSRDAERTEGEILARRILNVMAVEPFDAGDGRQARLTSSVGWAPYPWLADAAEAHSHEEVLKLADRALYLAKEGGRNRAVAAFPEGAGAGGERYEIGGVAFRAFTAIGPAAGAPDAQKTEGT